MNFLKFKSLIFILILLSGCVGSTVNIKKDQALTPQQGIVVTRLISNWEGYKNPLLAKLEFVFGKAESSLNSGKFMMNQKSDLKVVTLPAGKYSWSQLGFGNRSLSLNGDFTVKAGTITYIGDINSELTLGAFSAGVNIKVTSDLNSLKQQLKEKYPQQFLKYPLAFNKTNLKASP